MGSMIYQVQTALHAQLRVGESRHAAKRDESTHAPQGIFSYGTLKTYLKQACAFAKWANAVHGCNKLEKARPYAAAYLQTGVEKTFRPRR